MSKKRETNNKTTSKQRMYSITYLKKSVFVHLKRKYHFYVISIRNISTIKNIKLFFKLILRIILSVYCKLNVKMTLNKMSKLKMSISKSEKYWRKDLF